MAASAVCVLVVDGPGKCAMGLGSGEHEGYLRHLRFSNTHFCPWQHRKTCLLGSNSGIRGVEGFSIEYPASPRPEFETPSSPLDLDNSMDSLFSVAVRGSGLATTTVTESRK